MRTLGSCSPVGREDLLGSHFSRCEIRCGCYGALHKSLCLSPFELCTFPFLLRGLALASCQHFSLDRHFLLLRVESHICLEHSKMLLLVSFSSALISLLRDSSEKALEISALLGQVSRAKGASSLPGNYPFCQNPAPKAKCDIPRLPGK